MSHGKFEDLSGQKYGKLTVLYRAADYVQPSGQHKRMWHCRCECGKECDIRANDLKSGNTQSCGCFQQYSRGKSTYKDLTGKSFGRLTVMYRLPNHITPSGQQQRMWRCKCDCGKECDVYATQLMKGKSSCGCLSVEETQEKEIKRKTVIQKRKEQRKERSALLQKEKRDLYLITNSLEAKYPEIAIEWNYEKNTGIKDDFGRDISSPSRIPSASNKKVWWLGKCGHEWQAVVNSRTKQNSGCPYCANQKVLKGFNDLSTKYPNLVKEWDYNKNINLKPDDVISGSSKKVWWICSLGHSYEMSVGNRTGKQKCGCPYCSNPPKRVLKGFNDLATKHPELAAEWDYENNGQIRPDNVLCGSSKKIWWIGKCGHNFEQSIVNRVNGGNCPFCSHQKLLVGYNDFATEHPELLSEWDYKKNGIKPNELMSQSDKKVWWICPFGHSYQSWMTSRCGTNHSGCPICDKENHTSFPEQAVFYYIKKYYPDAINSDRTAIGIELDIFIPSLKIAIEYDGKNWHKNNKYELKKNSVCKENNILLMRIREDGLQLYEDCYCIVRKDVRSNKSLSETIKTILLDIDNISDVDVDVDRDSALIYGSYIVTRKEQSLLNTHPDIAAEWHPSKNGYLKSDMVAPMTNKKVWWLGKCGHEWQMQVSQRVGQNCGCPFCAGKQILKGFNDLATEYSELLKEWDYEKNNDLGIFPDKVTSHSDKKAWWKCNICGNEWYAKIDGRTRMKAGCPKCGIITISESKYKPVKCLDLNTVYKSIKEASSLTGISSSGISQCCRGITKTAGGYHWEYITEYKNE